ncbi:hypothetical protein CSB11_00790 [Candidatus Campbellbacteria bacterium]|nr:MAG: hypothetical protein CSB11_00790 [Candidatus Campbellbacteria bacterium]
MFTKLQDALKFNSTVKSIIIPIVIALVANMGIEMLTSIGIEMVLPTPEGKMISLGGTIGMFLNIVLSIILIINVSKIKVKDLGLGLKGVFGKVFIGMITGLAVLSLVGFSIYSLGGIEITYSFKPEFMFPILLGLVFFILQGTSEELIFRAYLMTHFSKKMGIPLAVLFSSIFFTLIHALNPGMVVMAIVNLMVFSVVFSMVYLISGNLWFTGIFHGLWNFSQGLLWGSLVSGITLQESVFKSTPVAENTLISGGTFGFEGSIVTTVVGLILIAILSVMYINKNKKS